MPRSRRGVNVSSTGPCIDGPALLMSILLLNMGTIAVSVIHQGFAIMQKIRVARLLAAAASVSFFAVAASADAGVPMLFVTFPAMVVALVPIVLLETVVLARTLKARAIPLAKSAAIANVVSTIIGIPLTWVALVILELVTDGGSAHGLATPLQKFLAVTWQAPWLIPYERELYWMVPAASLVLLVPFFFASYFIEAPIVARIERRFPAPQVRAAVFRANVASYIGLAIFNLVWLAWSIEHAPRM